jgi:hypothetical protein
VMVHALKAERVSGRRFILPSARRPSLTMSVRNHMG